MKFRNWYLNITIKTPFTISFYCLKKAVMANLCHCNSCQNQTHLMAFLCLELRAIMIVYTQHYRHYTRTVEIPILNVIFRKRKKMNFNEASMEHNPLLEPKHSSRLPNTNSIEESCPSLLWGRLRTPPLQPDRPSARSLVSRYSGIGSTHQGGLAWFVAHYWSIPK